MGDYHVDTRMQPPRWTVVIRYRDRGRPDCRVKNVRRVDPDAAGRLLLLVTHDHGEWMCEWDIIDSVEVLAG